MPTLATDSWVKKQQKINIHERDAFVKLFQMLQCIRNKKISGGFHHSCVTFSLILCMQHVHAFWLGGCSGYYGQKRGVSLWVKLDCCIFWTLWWHHTSRMGTCFSSSFFCRCCCSPWLNLALLSAILFVSEIPECLCDLENVTTEPPFTKWCVVNGWGINFGWNIPLRCGHIISWHAVFGLK